MTDPRVNPDDGECEIIEIRFGGILIAAAITEPDGTIRILTAADDESSPPDRE